MTPLRQRVSIDEFAMFPAFLRLDRITLWYWNDYDWRARRRSNKSIEEKCRLIESYLLPLKATLSHSNMLELHAGVSKTKRRDFSKLSVLLDYIRNQIFSICCNYRGYEFYISFDNDYSMISITNVITSLLQLPEISNCSNVQIVIGDPGYWNLPTEGITNWLEKSINAGKEQQDKGERLLKIGLGGILNIPEMLEHFKTVLSEIKCKNKILRMNGRTY